MTVHISRTAIAVPPAMHRPTTATTVRPYRRLREVDHPHRCRLRRDAGARRRTALDETRGA